MSVSLGIEAFTFAEMNSDLEAQEACNQARTSAEALPPDVGQQLIDLGSQLLQIDLCRSFGCFCGMFSES